MDGRHLTLRVLTDQQIEQVCGQTHSLWHQGRSREAYTERLQHALRCMQGNMRYVGLCDAAGRVLASARELDAELIWRGEVLPALGIAAVFVREDLRGQGYGKAVVRELVNDGRDRGNVMAYLFSDIAPMYYARLGFTPLDAYDWSAPIDALPEDNPFRVRSATTEDLGDLRRWYHGVLAEDRLTTRRSLTWWQYFRWWRNSPRDLVLSDGSREVGYITVNGDSQRLHVYEVAAPELDPSRVWATIRAIARSRGVSTVTGWWHSARQAEWMRLSERTEAIPMIAVLAPSIVPESVDAAFEELDHF